MACKVAIQDKKVHLKFLKYQADDYQIFFLTHQKFFDIHKLCQNGILVQSQIYFIMLIAIGSYVHNISIKFVLKI